MRPLKIYQLYCQLVQGPFLTKIQMGEKKFLIWVGCIALFCSSSYGQSWKAEEGWRYAIESSFDLENARNRQNSQDNYYLLQLKQGVRQETVAEAKLTVYRKGSDGFLIVKVPAAALLENSRLLENAWHVNDRWKLSENLRGNNSSGNETFTIKTIVPQQTLHALSGLPGLKILSVREGRIKFSATYKTLVEKIIPLEEVVYAGKEAGNPKAEARVQDMNLVANGINRIHHAYPELNGEGMVLSVQEMGFDAADIDLLGRELPSSLRAADNSLHATGMATIAAGAGNSDITGKGVAWAAKISSSDFADVLPDADQAYRELDTWVQNHSYGTLIENFYGTLAEAFDNSSRSNPALLHVISSGNQGLERGKGPYEGIPGYANLTGNFKMAKNILTIGAVDTVGNPMFFSSRGPAYDGRVKPELTAYSTAGSSNATALVSGLSVLLQQAYKEQQGSLPASALLKALLINSAGDAGPEGLDYQAGYGNVNGFKALENLKAGRYFSGSIAQGETETISLEVPANAKNLKVTLVWTEPAAQPNSDIALVNDLDMQLTDGNGLSWLPWVLDGQTNEASLVKAAVRKADHLNNIEQITIENPEAGLFTISVSAYDIPQGPQDFYIAYQWEEANEFSWAFPTGSDYIPYNGESTGYFRWESSLDASSGKLEYSMDGGESWQLIDEAVDLRKGAYRWEAPLVSGPALARMTVGDSLYTTEGFALSRPLTTSVGFDCGDSILIQWNKLDNAQAYRVFTLGDTYLESVELTTDTLLVLNKQALANPYFTVQPILQGGMPAIRSVTFDYVLQGAFCYFSSFFSELTPEHEIYLNLSLGTTYQVDEVILEKKVNGSWEVMARTPSGNVSNFRLLDEAPLQGLNVYRVRLELANGETLVSEEDRNYYLQEPPLMVFPNPVAGSDGLRIFSKNTEVQELHFKLYSQTGQLILQRILTSDRAFVSLSGLQAGLYFYSAELEGRPYHGRIVVE